MDVPRLLHDLGEKRPAMPRPASTSDEALRRPVASRCRTSSSSSPSSPSSALGRSLSPISPTDSSRGSEMAAVAPTTQVGARYRSRLDGIAMRAVDVVAALLLLTLTAPV